MNASYQQLTSEDEHLFQRHSKGIERDVRQTFPSIPANFQLKPVTVRKIIGCGMFYDFKIPLPDGQFAKVSFHTGGHSMRPPGEKEPEQQFNNLMLIPRQVHQNTNKQFILVFQKLFF